MQTDLSDSARNMFGLKPCPACSGTHCYPTQATAKQNPNCVVCDDCEWHEPLEELRSDPASMEHESPCELCNGTGFPGTTERICPQCAVGDNQ